MASFHVTLNLIMPSLGTIHFNSRSGHVPLRD